MRAKPPCANPLYLWDRTQILSCPRRQDCNPIPQRNRARSYRYLFLCCCLPPLIGCGAPGNVRQDSRGPVSLFAAASTKEAVERIARDFEAQTGVPVEVTLGPSSGLAKQIERGARADLFLSADEASADYLADKKLVAERRDLLSNRL